MSEWKEIAKEYAEEIDRMAEEIAKLRAECSGMGKLLQSGVVVKTDEYISMVDLQRKLAEMTADRDEWKDNERVSHELFEALSKDHEVLQAQLAASEAREVGLRGAMERVLVKVDWNSDEFHNPKQYAETRAIILEALATEPPALLGVLKEVEKRLHDIVGFGCVKPAVIDRWAQEALASLRKAIGGGG